MAEIHQLIMKHGRQGALELVGGEQRRLVDLAAEFMSNEDSEIGVAFSGFCLVGLPHRELPPDQIWRRENGAVKLLIEPGANPRTDKRVGVPYGAKARMILLYLQSEAIRRNNREVELGPSMHSWMDKMGVSTGGKSYRDLREQMLRLALCSLTFSIDAGDQLRLTSDRIIRAASFSAFDADPGQGRLRQDSVLLSETFFDALKKHPVPLLEAALRALSSQSQALDIYIWLAYRLHVLKRDTTISWDRLHQQFGAGYNRLSNFKRKFTESLRSAMAVYPEAEVDVTSRGLILHHSAPPVPDKFMILGRAP
jgi:hypothetical protein